MKIIVINVAKDDYEDAEYKALRVMVMEIRMTMRMMMMGKLVQMKIQKFM